MCHSYERYYLGGQYSLRGYDYRGVGPAASDSDGLHSNPIGGDTYWMASVEYSIPIISRLRFAMFYDIGNVYALPYSFSSSTIKGLRPPRCRGETTGPLNPDPDPFDAGKTGVYSDNWGIGLRLDLPIGPVAAGLWHSAHA